MKHHFNHGRQVFNFLFIKFCVQKNSFVICTHYSFSSSYLEFKFCNRSKKENEEGCDIKFDSLLLSNLIEFHVALDCDDALLCSDQVSMTD